MTEGPAPPAASTASNIHYYVVVTGANRGFGEAVAEAFADYVHARNETMEILLVGRDLTSLEVVGQDLTFTGDSGAWIKARCLGGIDFANLKTVAALNFQPRFTPNNKDVVAILVNNAGSLPDLSKTLKEQTAASDIHGVSNYIDSNLTSFLSLTSQFLTTSYSTESHRKGSRSWRSVIVNITSLLAIQAAKNWGLYAIVKSARNMAMKVMAAEETSDEIKTLSYAPGPMDNSMQAQVRESLADKEQNELYTKMHSDGNLVEMQESAARLIYILSSDAFESGAHVDYYDEE